MRLPSRTRIRGVVAAKFVATRARTTSRGVYCASTSTSTRSSTATSFTTAATSALLVPVILFATSALSFWNLPILISPSLTVNRQKLAFEPQDSSRFAPATLMHGRGQGQGQGHSQGKLCLSRNNNDYDSSRKLSLSGASSPRYDGASTNTNTNATKLPLKNPSAPNPLKNLLQSRFLIGDYYIWLYEDKHGIPTSWEMYTISEIRTSNEDHDHGHAADDNDDNDYSNAVIVVIEMSTKFSENEDFSTHHRMTVDMSHHLKADSDRHSWKIGFEYYTPNISIAADADNEQEHEQPENASQSQSRTGDTNQHGKWTQFGPGDNVQAFEEKFDLFSMLNMTTNPLQNSSSAHASCSRNIRMSEAPSPKNRESSAYTRTNNNEKTDLLTLIRTARHTYTGAWYCSYTPHNGNGNECLLAGVAIMKHFDEHSFSLIKLGTCADGRITEFDIEVQMDKG